jgi:heat shock protein HtpX
MFSGSRHCNGNGNSGMGVTGTLVMIALVPLAAMLVRIAMSPTRECAADNMRTPHGKS